MTCEKKHILLTLNGFPQTDSPPSPVPVGSPPWNGRTHRTNSSSLNKSLTCETPNMNCTNLNNESFDDSVKNNSIIISFQAQLDKIPASLGSFFRPEFDVYVTNWRRHQDLSESSTTNLYLVLTQIGNRFLEDAANTRSTWSNAKVVFVYSVMASHCCATISIAGRNGMWVVASNNWIKSM